MINTHGLSDGGRAAWRGRYRRDDGHLMAPPGVTWWGLGYRAKSVLGVIHAMLRASTRQGEAWVQYCRELKTRAPFLGDFDDEGYCRCGACAWSRPITFASNVSAPTPLNKGLIEQLDAALRVAILGQVGGGDGG